MSNRSVL